MIKQNKILFTTVTAAILVVALSFVLPKNGEKYLEDMFWVRKTFSSANKDIILMGDSRVYRGVSPSIMKKELPDYNILNFGFSNGGLNPTMFAAAEKKLQNAENHKVIVLGITANTLSGYTINNTQYIKELNRPREEILERLYLNPVSYWFSATTPEGLKDYYQKKNKPKEIWYISNYKMNGYVESDKFPVDTLEAIASYTKDFKAFTVDTPYMQVLFKQVEHWISNGIIVLAFRPPISLPMRKLEDNMGLYNERTISEGIITAGGHWINIQHSAYQTYDGSHVDRNSAEKLSLKIASEIRSLIPE